MVLSYFLVNFFFQGFPKVMGRQYYWILMKIWPYLAIFGHILAPKRLKIELTGVKLFFDHFFSSKASLKWWVGNIIEYWRLSNENLAIFGHIWSYLDIFRLQNSWKLNEMMEFFWGEFLFSKLPWCFLESRQDLWWSSKWWL